MTEQELSRYIGMYYPNIYAAALCQCKNPSYADDIAQDTFLALYTYGGKFESDEHTKAWLIRCALNKSINLLRSHWYRFSLPLESAAGRLSSPDDTASVELLETIMKLGKNSRTVLYLYYYEEYSTAETAEILGISESAARTRLTRAKKQLKKLLTDERN